MSDARDDSDDSRSAVAARDGESSTATTRDLAADLDWCHDVVQDVSRTFAITIEVLDEPMASSICLGYLTCRIPDTIEDANHIPPSEQVTLLELYDRVLDPEAAATPQEFVEAVDPYLPAPEDRSADWDLVAETPRVLRVFEAQPDAVTAAIRPPARELVSGMAMFVDRYADSDGVRIQTRAELREYCHYAAGTVGELITNLVCDDSTTQDTEDCLYENAESFGLLLQLVNVAKDVYDDFHEENNVYLPAEDLEAVGVSQEAVCEPENREAASSVVAATIGYARTFLDDAQTYLETVPETRGNRVAAWAIPYLLAVGTLREVQSRPADALAEGDVKVSRSEVSAIIDRTLGLDPEELASLREAVAAKSLHE